MKDILSHLLTGQPLSLEQTVEAFEQIMTGQASAAQVGALLAMVQLRGPTVDEITGAATVMRQKATRVLVPHGLTVIDTCGTGGDHTPTFNISSASALVAAAIGRPRGVVVAKHGNRTVTRASGSSQGLAALGVKLNVDGKTLTRCLDEAGICFCFAPAHHPAMKHAMPIRTELGIHTIFNLLGPLTNPAGATRQVIGVFRPDLTDVLAQVLKDLGTESALVCHGKKQTDASGPGFCEISTCGPSRITQLTQGQLKTFEVEPKQLGIPHTEIDTLLVKDPDHSAAVIKSVLSGEKGPARDIVCINAAAALVVADLAADLPEGLERAAGAIDGGDAMSTLDRLISITQSDSSS